MLKRILIEVAVTLTVIALLSGSVVGYFWLRDAPDRAKRRKAAANLAVGLVAQKKALGTLGDVDFDTAGLALAPLNQKLKEPRLRKSGAQDSTVVAWACTGSQLRDYRFVYDAIRAGNSCRFGTSCRRVDEAQGFGHAYFLNRWNSP